MSRIGKEPISVPSNVTVDISGAQIAVTGPKGTLTQFTMPEVKVALNDNQLIVTRENDEKVARSKHGLMRTLLSNMVTGVTDGFKKQLEINGVGFRANAQGRQLVLNVGFSHQVTYALPEGIDVTVEQNLITVSGIDKQRVGQVAAEIRAIKKPEPYKGKGIKYVGEYIIRKAGKTGAGGEK